MIPCVASATGAPCQHCVKNHCKSCGGGRRLSEMEDDAEAFANGEAAIGLLADDALASEEPRRERSQSSWRRSSRTVRRFSCVSGADARQVNRRTGG
eukprot:6821246-Heterocapsa_arctica.AAC.1